MILTNDIIIEDYVKKHNPMMVLHRIYLVQTVLAYPRSFITFTTEPMVVLNSRYRSFRHECDRSNSILTEEQSHEFYKKFVFKVLTRQPVEFSSK